jgi:phosphoribosylaminoimidazole-succinocarboxamide synthase
MSNEQEYKEIIKANLNNVLTSGFVPELGTHKKGKVRDNHFLEDRVVMIASDRVSSFDHVLSRAIPFKGVILNLFNEWAMENAADVMPNAMLPSPDPNVIIQTAFPNYGFECVVRGFVWGSMAADYENGSRTKSGISLPEGLLRYQKLDEPIFTPTTKVEKGHDLDISMVAMGSLGPKAQEASIRLFKRYQQLAAEKGLFLIDTKYEFGDTLKNEVSLVLIDESTTPDSSRFCSIEEYNDKWPRIFEYMRTGKWEDVSALLKEKPELKIKEESKQFVRDVLIAGGYKDGTKIPDLTDDQIVETAWRYISSYETLTGKTFDFAQSELPTVKKRIMNNLVKAGIAYGACVVPIGASKTDAEHWGKLEKALTEAKVPFTQPFYGSAHRETQQVLDFVHNMDATSIEPLVYLTFAGRSNGLGPVVAGNTPYPVIANPVFSDIGTYSVDIHSSLRMPSKLPLAVVVDPGNAALMAKRIVDMVR